MTFFTWNVAWWNTSFNVGDEITFRYLHSLSPEDTYTFTPDRDGSLILYQPQEDMFFQIFEDSQESIYFEWENTLNYGSEHEQVLVIWAEDQNSDDIVWEFLDNDVGDNETGAFSYDLDLGDIRAGLMEYQPSTMSLIFHWDVISYNINDFDGPLNAYDAYRNDEDSGEFYSASNGPNSFLLRNVVNQTFYVSALTGDDGNNDGSESSPFSSISHAIDMAFDNDIIMVGEGVYDPITIYKYVTIIGENKENTIIDGGSASNCVYIGNVNYDSQSNPIHMSGFTFQNGNSGGAGGIHINWTPNVYLSDLIIKNNVSDGYNGAGGIFLQFYSNVILNDVIIENNTGYYAGAIAVGEWCGLDINNSMILHNYNWNYADESYPGGVALWGGSDASFHKVTIAFNQFAGIGIGHQNYNLTEINVDISSSTLYGNEEEAIRSMYDVDAININVHNSILWANGVVSDLQASLNASTGMFISYSNIGGDIDLNAGGLEFGDGVISEDPLFIDPWGMNDFNLHPESPCIDSGDPNSSLDPDGTIADMGSHYFHQVPDQIVGVSETGGTGGDTVSVSVYVDLGEQYPLNGFSVTVAGLGGGDITAVGVDTAGTIMTSDWLWSYFINDSGTVVITAGAGAEPIQALGSLFNVHFVIDESSEGGFFPVFIADALFNEDEEMQYESINGGVAVLGIGDVSMNGIVQAYDASLILQHLVGLDTLSVDQQNVGDVTDDNSLSALDAAIILDHVVGLVDELPYTPGSANLDAMMAISGGSVEPGELFQVPIELTDGTNVRSFELAFDYDIDALSVEQIVWDTEVLSGLQVLDNQQEGMILVSAAGMGSSLSSGSQTLGYIEFRMNEFFDDVQTSITLSRSRVNELDAVIEGSVALYTNSTLVVSDWGDGGVPMEFALNQNYPNPFNPSTMIRYQLPEQTMVTIAIYDLMGRKVRTLVPGETQLAGYRQVVWNATNDFGQPVSAGMYIYTIQAGTYRMTKKMVLMK